ncbi:cupin domain-containing protein [Pseudomonas gingeri]
MSPSFNTMPLSTADPFGEHRQVAYTGADGICARIVSTGQALDIDVFPHTEMIVIHAGNVLLQSRGQTLKLRVGVWDSTPYERQGRAHKLNELVHLIEGSVTLQGPEGTSLTVNTGDTVFVPQSTPCAWKSTRYVRKFYAVK